MQDEHNETTLQDAQALFAQRCKCIAQSMHYKKHSALALRKQIAEASFDTADLTEDQLMDISSSRIGYELAVLNEDMSTQIRIQDALSTLSKIADADPI